MKRIYQRIKGLQLYIAALSLLGVIAGCKTDFTTIGDYKETTVIYGILNPDSATQYIKIQKAFLGEGDVLKMAQEKDSVFYGKELVAWMERIKDGKKMDSIPLIAYDSIPQNPGQFSTKQTLYITKAKISQEDGTIYKLYAKNTKTGHLATAETPIITNFLVDAPASNPKAAIAFTDNTVTTRYLKPKIGFYTAKNGRQYKLTLRFRYIDVDEKDPSIQTERHVDWSQADIYTEQKSSEQATELFFILDGEAFYNRLASQISAFPQGIVSRKFVGCDLYFTVISDYLSTYIDVNKPSTGIVQSKPVFTNVKNGIGIFSSALTYRVYKKPLDNASLYELINGKITINRYFK